MMFFGWEDVVCFGGCDRDRVIDGSEFICIYEIRVCEVFSINVFVEVLNEVLYGQLVYYLILFFEGFCLLVEGFSLFWY